VAQIVQPEVFDSSAPTSPQKSQRDVLRTVLFVFGEHAIRRPGIAGTRNSGREKPRRRQSLGAFAAEIPLFGAVTSLRRLLVGVLQLAEPLFVIGALPLPASFTCSRSKPQRVKTTLPSHSAKAADAPK
jgi:hypothetical protein